MDNNATYSSPKRSVPLSSVSRSCVTIPITTATTPAIPPEQQYPQLSRLQHTVARARLFGRQLLYQPKRLTLVTFQTNGINHLQHFSGPDALDRVTEALNDIARIQHHLWIEEFTKLTPLIKDRHLELQYDLDAAKLFRHQQNTAELRAIQLGSFTYSLAGIQALCTFIGDLDLQQASIGAQSAVHNPCSPVV